MLSGPVRTWKKPQDDTSPCGNTTISGWARAEGSSKRLNITQKSWYSAYWTISHFCAPHLGVVDATCGTGTSGDAAIRSGRHFLGLDFCPDAAQHTKRRLEAAMWEEKGRMLAARIIETANTEQEEAATRLQAAAVANDDRTMSQEDADKCIQIIKEAVDAGKVLDPTLKSFYDDQAAQPRWYQAASVYFSASTPALATRWFKKTKLEAISWVKERPQVLQMVNAARAAKQWPILDPGQKVSDEMWELQHEVNPAQGS